MFSIFNNLAPLKLSKDPCDTPIVAIKKKHTNRDIFYLEVNF